MDVVALLVIGSLVAFSVPLLLANPARCWFCYVLLLPMNGLSVSIGPAIFRPEHFGLALLLLSLFRPRGNLRQRPSFSLLIGALSAAFWLLWGCVVSSFSSPELTSSLGVLTWITLSMGALAAVYFLPLQAADMVRVGTVAMGVVGAASLVMWLIGQLTTQATLLSTLTDGLSPARVNALSFEPNIMGALCVLWLALYLSYRHQLPAGLAPLAVLISVAGILTMTRAAWLAMAIVLGLHGIRSGQRKIRRLMAAVSVAVPVAYVSLPPLRPLVEQIVNRALGFSDLSTGTAGYRVTSWNVAFSDLERTGAWLVGLGVNSYSQRHDGAVGYSSYQSNAWIALIYDTGLVGVAAFIAIFVAFLAHSRRKWDLIILLIALGLTSAVTNALWFAFPWVIVALALRLDYVEERVSDPGSVRLRREHFKTRRILST